MCVIPGTIWSELALDRSTLLVHLFDLQSTRLRPTLSTVRRRL
jgi:multicomponent K+:H+ antiporter subunit E